MFQFLTLCKMFRRCKKSRPIRKKRRNRNRKVSRNRLNRSGFCGSELTPKNLRFGRSYRIGQWFSLENREGDCDLLHRIVKSSWKRGKWSFISVHESSELRSGRLNRGQRTTRSPYPPDRIVSADNARRNDRSVIFERRVYRAAGSRSGEQRSWLQHRSCSAQTRLAFEPL